MAKLMPRYCNENAILFMWATYPRLDFAVEILKHAGFSYKTVGFTWVKTTNDGSRYRYGPGFYTASNPEVCLIGVKGSGFEPRQKMTSSIITAPRLEHSKKPKLHARLDALYPDAHKIELFARQSDHKGWDYWGNQVGSQTTPTEDLQR